MFIAGVKHCDDVGDVTGNANHIVGTRSHSINSYSLDVAVIVSEQTFVGKSELLGLESEPVDEGFAIIIVVFGD